MHWYLKVLKKYATFGGRAGRKEYWMFRLFDIIIPGTLIGALGLIFLKFLAPPELSASRALLYGNFIPCGIYYFGTLIPRIAGGVRRMHDIGRSGWWFIVPIVGSVFLFFRGQPNDNEYGPVPKTTTT